ncbi:hypothetical protein DL93DRAFT_513808 [Clavulina sp. PMI_390]|nr:hypothetical protein DL93DRAFT_513808 [Clavulina sp. PMI_390]
MYPYFEDLTPALRTSAEVVPHLGREVTVGYSPLIHRTVVEHALDSCQLVSEDDDLPPLASRYLISLFLPHRSRFHFFMDTSYFLHSLSLPSSHPESIHPCLRYACYLAACIMTGGRLASLQPYMLARTRHFLNQSLMFADRLPHFLWASMILASYMIGRMRRLEEAFAIVSSAARLASACGLTRNPHTSREDDYLLPPAKDDAEAEDRIRLARGIYLTDQILATVSRFYPTFPYNGEAYEVDMEMKNPNDRPSVMELRVSTVNLFERVIDFGRLVCAHDREHSYWSLKEQITLFESSVPGLSDSLEFGLFEAVSSSRPHMFFAHMTMYGSAMVLHSLQASSDSEARREMLKNLQSLVNICDESRGPQRINSVQAGLPSMVNLLGILMMGGCS